jgi:hypothetical protein
VASPCTTDRALLRSDSGTEPQIMNLGDGHWILLQEAMPKTSGLEVFHIASH